jgi:hypothetical protein
MRLISAILTALLMFGCSASFHARRAIKKNPQAFRSDTVLVIDTVVMEIPKVDTTFIYQFDTVEYVQEDVIIKYHYDTLTNKVYINADCPDQETIIKTKTITLPPIIIKPNIWDKIKSGFIISLIIVVVALIAKSVIKSVL